MEFGLSGTSFGMWLVLWLIIPGIVGLLVWGYRKRKSDAEQFGYYNTVLRLIPDDIWKNRHDVNAAHTGNQDLRTRLIRQAFRRRRNLKFTLLILAAAAIILAFGRPQWGTRQEEIFKRGIDLVLLIDTSYSMNAQDVAPSRLIKAKSEIATLLKLLENNRAALVSFATTTKLHCPLTLDFRGLESILDHSLNMGPGTNIQRAIEESLRVLKKSSARSKAILLISDGEDHEGDLDTILKELKKNDVRLFALGIGTPEGGPIPDVGDGAISSDKDAGYKKQNGEIVWTRLVEDDLIHLAEVSGGTYYRASSTESEAGLLADDIHKLEKTEFSQTVTTRKEEQFPFFLFLAIFFLLTEVALVDYGTAVWEED